jgi:hypothetical protein
VKKGWGSLIKNHGVEKEYQFYTLELVKDPLGAFTAVKNHLSDFWGSSVLFTPLVVSF